jgi:hypothetical protein
VARIRNIKPEFYSHEELNDLENNFPELKPMLVFSGLWNQCEYSGVFLWSVRKLKLAILPFIDFDMTKSLELLEKQGFIRRYRKDGKEYGHVINFTKYQAISGSEKKSGLKYPLPDDDTVTEPVLSYDDTVTEPVLSWESQKTADLGLRTKDLGQRTNDDDEESNSSSSSAVQSGFQDATDPRPADPHPPDLQPRQTSPPGIFSDAAAVWEIIRVAWNRHKCPYTCDKIYLNLSPAQRERVQGSMATYTPEQMVRGIDRYFEEREAKPDGYEYKSFYLFVEKGMEFYVET